MSNAVNKYTPSRLLIILFFSCLTQLGCDRLTSDRLSTAPTPATTPTPTPSTSPTPTPTPSSTLGTLTGKVLFDNTDKGAGVTVALVSGSTILQTTTTDSDGNYVFASLSAGTYKINASKTDYYPCSSCASAITMQGGQTVAAPTISLDPKSQLKLGLFSVSGPGTFTALPINFSEIVEIVPLGSQGGHVLPTDHCYFTANEFLTKTHVVYAPGDGVVIYLPPKNNFIIQMTKTFAYYLGHVVIDPEIKVGMKVRAGQRLGISDAPTSGCDLGIINTDVTLTGFVRPERFPYKSVHADSAIKYFAEPVRSSVLEKVIRIGNDKYGKIDHDIPGRLVGNWFHESMPDSSEPEEKALSIAYWCQDPRIIWISIGKDGGLSMPGRWGVRFDDPDPATITPSNGKVVYRLYGSKPQGTSNDSPWGYFLVQMLDSNRIKTETFKGVPQAPENFTSNAVIFTR